MNKEFEVVLKIGQIIAAREFLKTCKDLRHLSPKAEQAITEAQQSLLDAQTLLEKTLED
jgi:hypothetical protein